jgi:chemotaxis signal transduction protein
MLRIPRQLVLFRVGNTHYGLDIDAVDEILPLIAITPVAGAQEGVLGLADVRKRVVPVFDLHAKFRVARPPDDRESRLILVDTAQGSVALLVDAVEEVLTVQREDFQHVAPPGDRRGLAYLNGIVRRDDSLVVWVDHHGLVPENVGDVLEAA